MNTRALAIQILARVEATSAYLNRVLEERLASFPPQDARDAAFITELCYGATRRRLWLDFALRAASDRRLETLEDRVLAALRLGAYQAFFMRVPPRAAVAETVEALRELSLDRATGFANAVLRKVVSSPELPLPEGASWLTRQSLMQSHPEWLVARWEVAHGRTNAEAMLNADNQAPEVTLRVNSVRGTRDDLVAELREVGLDARPTPCSPSGLALAQAGRLEAVYGYDDGWWQVQDEAAQLVGYWVAAPPGARVWDVCAAPGGKSCHLAERGPVLATDLHSNKLPRIEAEAERLGLRQNIELLAHDALTPLPAAHGDFDAVLLDAPCTGLGTLRRHPELRYRRVEADVERLAQLQAQLLEQVHRRVRPGGLLIYAVCSTEPEEGERQVARFLAAHAEFSPAPPTLPFDAGPARADGYLRTWPGPQNWDGFFAARLRRGT
jgi:16S rRNA (cytosine967-C5)-methyltransferase